MQNAFELHPCLPAMSIADRAAESTPLSSSPSSSSDALATLRFDEPPSGPRTRHPRRHMPPTLLAEPRVLAAVRRIERDLSVEHPLDELAQLCGLSPFHFHRLFAGVMGETLSGFTRRERLDVAAIRLAASEMQVLEIAANAGYGSLAAFSRAFQRQFGAPPSAYRPAARAAAPAMHEPLLEQLAARVRVERWEARPMIALRFYGGYDQVENYWVRFAEEVAKLGLDPESLEVYGLIRDNPEITAQGLIRYDCCFVDPGLADPLPAPFSRCEMSSCRSATLAHQGPYYEIFPAYRALANVWCAREGEQFAEAPAMERYHAPPWRNAGAAQSFTIMVMLV
jgi:AraC family transcriptional regulator